MDEENEILASFTFGKETLKISSQEENDKQKKSQKHSIINNKQKKQKIYTEIINNNSNNFFENYSAQNYNIIKGELNELTFGTNKNSLTNRGEKNGGSNKINKNINNYSILINPEGINDSFIFSIIYSIHHMKLFRQYIINDLNQQMQNNDNSISLLYNLREILIQMDKNKFINIFNFRNILSNLFQNHRKFLIDQPDDPVDLLFVLINSIHSFSIKFPLNEISDENCTEKCFSHKFIWLDLSRIDKCKCNGSTKRLFSNHNYITDIPINKIFNLIQIKKNMPLYESNQKLFEYYTYLISKIKSNCPVNGKRCPINKTFHKLHLSNSPSYLIFNLEQNFNEYDSNFTFSALNILKNFVLIPNKFDIWNLFELNSTKNKNNFDFIGCVLFKITKVYSCAFKNSRGLLVYYDCNWRENNYENNNNVIEFVSYYDFVFFCIKNGLIPIMLFYQGNFLTIKERNKNIMMNKYDENLNEEQINLLEEFSNNTDNLYNILQNTLRKKENLISTKNSKMKNIKQNINNILINEYTCPNCNYNNTIKDKICINCKNDNNEYLSKKIVIKYIPNNNITEKKEFQSLNNYNALTNKLKPLSLYYYKFQKSQDNIRMNKDKDKDIKNSKIKAQLNKRKKLCVSPNIKHRESDRFLVKYNFETNPDKINKYVLNVPLISPIQFLPAKKNITKNNKYILNKTEIDKKDDNIFNFKKINIIKSIPKSPKVKRNTIRQYTSNKLINKIPNHKKILSTNEKFDFLSTDNNNNGINNKNAKLQNMEEKNYKTSKTITNNGKIAKNKINELLFLRRENFDLKKEYEKMNDKMNKSNTNINATMMHYSYNDIHLYKNDKRKKSKIKKS